MNEEFALHHLPVYVRPFRCTDGIVFVVDSVDVERMEEAKMELMRTAKCSENHVSIIQSFDFCQIERSHDGSSEKQSAVVFDVALNELFI